MPSKHTRYRNKITSRAVLLEATDRTPVPRISIYEYHKGHARFARRVLILALRKMGMKHDAARYHARKQEGSGTVRTQFNNVLNSIGFED